MTAFISWYIVITILGWLTFPLAYRLFPALQDRGYAFSRAFGLLIWGYVFWLFASLGIAQNDIGGLLLALLILIGLSAWAIFKDNEQWTMVQWLRANRLFITTTEALFLVAFALMAWIRANNPEIYTSGGEKWMETAFINAILHSATFPPHDPWLSGYAISYYYFGYVMAAMLAKLTATIAPVAHNLMLSLIFALSAVGAYGFLYNLLSAYRRSKGEAEEPTRGLPVSGALLGPLFLLIVSNLEGVFESLRSKGVGWIVAADGAATPSSFWSWIDLQIISKTPPMLPLKWAPTEFFWWWRASRVIMDYDLTGKWMGDIIDEFPFFSYLLGDLHPHVLAMPFNLLALAVALNIFLGGWQGRINLFFGELRISKLGFLIVAFVLGGLAFLNTWDILLGAALIVLSYTLAQVRESGWNWERVADIFLLGIPAGVSAFLLYLPFFVSFDSQAKGLLPNFMFVTRPVHLWIMWGTLFIPILAYLIYLARGRASANWRAGILTSFGIVLALIVMMFVIGFMGLKVRPEDVKYILDSQGRTLSQFIADSMNHRLIKLGSLLTLLALMIPSLAFLFKRSEFSEEEFSQEQSSAISPLPFIFLLMTLGILLILAPEFVYLRDNFSYRINTVFKFYYQAWILLSLVAAFAVVVMLSELRGASATVYSIVIAIVIGLGLVYPMFSIPSKTDNFKTSNLQNDPEQIKQRTLDGSAYLARSMPDDYKAFQFMQTLEPGVVAEAVGGQYSEYARVATFTGMPDVLGWPGHEGQWRDNSLQGTRENDIQTLYTTSDWSTAQEIISKYNVRYVYIGNLERSTYPVDGEKFGLFLKQIYQQGSVTIYEVPSAPLATP